MKAVPFYKVLTLSLLLCSFQAASACSMYKISHGGKTMVGNNEDAWRTTPHIWFETSRDGSYGCCFSGSRRIGNDLYAPQAGMNEYGLAFSRLASYHPELPGDAASRKQPISHPDLFLKEVLRKCKSVAEVRTFLEVYDRTCYLHDVFVYVDASGEYLVAEPYQLITGSDPVFVQANFCPSITPEADRRRQKRYQVGADILKARQDTSLAFCEYVSDAMSVCRAKAGDGTLATTIWDTRQKQVSLYFYHDLSNRKVFDLSEELARGDHQYFIPDLFGENREFETLKTYITPFNTPSVRISLAVTGLFFLLSGLFFAGSSLLYRKQEGRLFRLLLTLFLGISAFYLFILATNIGIFYFPAPYIHPGSALLSLTSYFPYLILGNLLALLMLHFRNRPFRNWGKVSRGLLILNSSLQGIWVAGFFYWGLI